MSAPHAALFRPTGATLAQSRVIARGRGIRDLRRLVATYGGNPSRWAKKSSAPIVVGRLRYEYHWYEHPGIGRVEMKRKRLLQP